MYKTCFILLVILLFSCVEEAVYDDTPFQLEYGDLPEPNLPQDNPLTVEGVNLGRMLFYDNILSKDSKQACADCHVQQDGFSDIKQFSIGVEELTGTRQAMSIFNMAYHNSGFFWDGRAATLREQALLPIQDPLEMNESLENVIFKLESDNTYIRQFIKAFNSESITTELVGKALEQFMLSIISYNSKHDQVKRGEAIFTESERRGKQLFEAEYNPFFPNESGADCQHCHGGHNFENDLYMNNGLDEDQNMMDLGRANITMLSSDNGKFKVPTLRNIALTPPYMHDGRFSTLEEVLEHYDHGLVNSSTLDFALANTMQTGLQLTDQDKKDIIDYLNTLTDYQFINNQEYSNPF